MHLLRTSRPDHFDNLLARGTADNRVVHQHDAPSLKHGAIGGVLQFHAQVAYVVGRLDEGAANIVIAYDAELEGKDVYKRQTLPVRNLVQNQMH